MDEVDQEKTVVAPGIIDSPDWAVSFQQFSGSTLMVIIGVIGQDFLNSCKSLAQIFSKTQGFHAESCRVFEPPLEAGKCQWQTNVRLISNRVSKDLALKRLGIIKKMGW